MKREKIEKGLLASEWSREGSTLVSCGRVHCDLTLLGSPWVALGPRGSPGSQLEL